MTAARLASLSAYRQPRLLRPVPARQPVTVKTDEAGRPEVKAPAGTPGRAMTPVQTRAPAKAETGKAQQAFFSRLGQRVFTQRNLCIIGVSGGAAALAGAFAALSSKVGAVAAANLVAVHTAAFLQPGVVITAFALKTSATVAASATLPLLIPIASTVLVGGAAVAVTFYIVRALKNKMVDGLGYAKDVALAIPKAMLQQIPGGSAIVAMFETPETIGCAHHYDNIEEMRQQRQFWGMTDKEVDERLDDLRELRESELAARKAVLDSTPAREQTVDGAEVVTEERAELPKVDGLLVKDTRPKADAPIADKVQQAKALLEKPAARPVQAEVAPTKLAAYLSYERLED